MSDITKNLKFFFHKYKHAWVFLYVLIYMPWFGWLEKTVTTNYYVIHSVFDDYIPFCEYFIIPYLIWFPYIAIVLLYFFFTDKTGFYKATKLLFTGMTLFLVISTVFPNGLNLRPIVFERTNMFTDMVQVLYQTDTSTNVLPSLHVFNSIGVSIAVANSEKLKQYKWVQLSSLVLTTLIVLSTMFLKQHSIIDVVAGCIMAYLLYRLVYEAKAEKSPSLAGQII